MNEQGNPAEDHVHIMISYENARSLKNIAKVLKDKRRKVGTGKTSPEKTVIPSSTENQNK